MSKDGTTKKNLRGERNMKEIKSEPQEKILRKAKYIYPDGDQIENLCEKYPGAEEDIRIFVDNKTSYFRNKPFQEEYKDVINQKIKENIRFFNPNYIPKKNVVPNKEEETAEIEDQNPIQILWDEDLETFEEEDKEWIIEKLIPTRSVCVLTGKRGTMKTFVTMLMSYSVAAGLPFLGHFQTKQGGILYLDKENGVPIMRGRKRMIKKGLGLAATLPIGYICFSQLKIDKNIDLWKLEEKIVEHKPALLIIDTYRRGISFDENDAGAVSKLFVDALRPMVEKHNISIILIHHNRKSSQGDSRDEMDEIRGSSDLANYADIIMKTERKAGNLVLKQLKNRNAREEPPIEIGVEFNEEEDFLKMTYGGEFKSVTKSEKCVEVLCLWITEKKLHSFTTNDAQKMCNKLNFKVGTFKNALIDMLNANLITKLMKGVYEVNQQKFVVDRAE